MNATGAGGRRLRVVVADDSFLVREAIVAMLRSAEELELAAVCEDLPSLLSAVDAAPPDVVITDIRMPPTFSDEGIRAATQLRASHPHVGVVVLSQYMDPAYVLDLFRTGSEARAYLLKERLSDRADLIDAVRAVASGESAIDPKVVELLVVSRTRLEDSPLSQLSDREGEILAEIAAGKGNAAIARTLRLSKRSVEKYVHTIFAKLGLVESEEVSRRVKAALIFLAADPSEPPGPRPGRTGVVPAPHGHTASHP